MMHLRLAHHLPTATDQTAQPVPSADQQQALSQDRIQSVADHIQRPGHLQIIAAGHQHRAGSLLFSQRHYQR